MYWDITSLYPSEYIDLVASFHWQLLYIRLETTTAKVAYNITTTIPIDYKQDYTIPEIVSLLSPSFKALYLTFVSCNHWRQVDN